MKEEYDNVEEILTKIVVKEVKTRFCTLCLGKLSQHKKSPNVVRCSKRGCRHEFTLFKKRPFFNAKIPWLKIAQVLYLYLNNASCKIINFLTGISKKSIGKLLKQAGERLNGNQLIGGPGIIVEIDESKFGKRKYHRGHKVEGVWVLGMVERSPERKIVLLPVKNRKAETLIKIIREYVREGSIIYTDCWKGYSKLSNYGYFHHTVNHSINFVDKDTGVHTNTIEGNWMGVKMNIPARYRNKKDISRFLALFAFKRNNQSSLLEKLLKNVLN